MLVSKKDLNLTWHVKMVINALFRLFCRRVEGPVFSFYCQCFWRMLEGPVFYFSVCFLCFYYPQVEIFLLRQIEFLLFAVRINNSRHYFLYYFKGYLLKNFFFEWIFKDLFIYCELLWHLYLR